ncbi:MAG: hypothetical protein EON51_18800 [Acinetobacter sp.]|nr:MAG: hypothetical protein EON51_18800 [Acinetobacter sp.]
MKLFYLLIFLNCYHVVNLEFSRVQETEKGFKFKSLNSYKSALLEAKESNKKLFIYFTGYGDINSRKMEVESFTSLEVKLLLQKNYLCFNTYLDDPAELPIEEQFFSRELNKKVKTIGQKFQDFQLSKFKSDKQPHFLIIDNYGKVIMQRVGYQNKKELILFLKNGAK